MNETLGDFSAWNEKSKGYYRYVIASNCCYEILIRRYVEGADIMSARAELYLAADWHNNGNGEDSFERNLLGRATVRDCVEHAVRDYRTMHMEK